MQIQVKKCYERSSNLQIEALQPMVKDVLGNQMMMLQQQNHIIQSLMLLFNTAILQ